MKKPHVLDVPMGPNDPGAETIHQYLKELLSALWEEGEAFSGKRPFGNSGWEYDLYIPLVKAGLVEGELDEDGNIVDFDKEAADMKIFEAIAAL